MLVRRNILKHPLGSILDLPRLVPSFSSKGFPLITERKNRTIKGGKSEPLVYSESSKALETIGSLINDSILVSAYDIHHKYLRKPARFFRGKEVVFIDSGGYEMSADWDSTEPRQWPHEIKPITKEDYIKVLKKLPKGIPFIISNFDYDSKGKLVADQILAAQELFSDFPNTLHNFILKPPKKGRDISIKDILPEIGKLRAFGLVGLTEKELGKNHLKRLITIAEFRIAMNREGVDIPIHIWGGLDPTLTPLYFLAGAEVFDGISWLRYAYHEGKAIYRDSPAILKWGIQTTKDHLWSMVINENINALQKLTNDMKSFADSKKVDFRKFEWNADKLKEAYRVLCTKVPELKGDI